MAGIRVISADSHMMEPADLWQTRLDSKFRDDAPKVVPNEKGSGYLFVAPGVRPFPVAGGFGIGKSGQELKEHLKKGYEAAAAPRYFSTYGRCAWYRIDQRKRLRRGNLLGPRAKSRDLHCRTDG